jgi:hypothetical protein
MSRFIAGLIAGKTDTRSNTMKNEDKLNETLELVRQGDWCTANLLLDGFGIESVNCEDRYLTYINLGDTYETTICQENGQEPFIGNWGDWMEQAEAKYEEENGVIRCGYCGEFTPVYDDFKPEDTLCDFCGHLVLE